MKLHFLIFISFSSSVYKVYLKYPKLNQEGHCGKYQLCNCEDSEDLKPWKVYDIANDVAEQKPLKLTK